MLTLFGCKDAAEIQVMKEKLLLENKKYFNSERAANILYREATKYFKYGTFLYPRPESTLAYYRVLGDEPPYHMKKITKKQADKIDKEGKDSYIRIYTDEDNRIDACFSNNMLSHTFDAKNKKSLFNINNDIDRTQIYVTSCHPEECIVREDTEDWISYGQGFPIKFTNKAFKNYHSYYNGKEIIYDNQSRILKKIDYKGTKIKYYFYDYGKRYEVVCNYINEECEIKHNCEIEYKNDKSEYKNGQECGLIES